MGEMEEIAETFREAGLPDRFRPGVASIYTLLRKFKDQTGSVQSDFNLDSRLRGSDNHFATYLWDTKLETVSTLFIVVFQNGFAQPRDGEVIGNDVNLEAKFFCGFGRNGSDAGDLDAINELRKSVSRY